MGAGSHKRGRRALARTGKIDIGRIRRRDGDRCYMCGVTTHKLSNSSRKNGTGRILEHVVPLVLGGEDTMFNLRVACISCDSKKGGDAEMVDIMALLPALTDDKWLTATLPEPEVQPKKPPVLYRHVRPWTPPPKEEEVDAYTMHVIPPQRPKPPDLKVKPKIRNQDGWWNYESPRPKTNTISATQVTSREQLREWLDRNKEEGKRVADKKTYLVYVEGTSRETYEVEATSEEEARQIWSDFPVIQSEIDNCSVESVETP